MDLLEEEPVALGRNTIFTVPKKFKEIERIEKIGKKIKKKEKNIDYLKNTIKKNLEAKQSFSKKQEELKQLMIQEESKMEMEIKPLSKEEVNQQLESM